MTRTISGLVSLSLVPLSPRAAAHRAMRGGSAATPTPAPVPTPTQTPVPSISKVDAFRFLNQATMGATQAEADRVIALGYEAWIDEQLLRPASLELPHVQSLPAPQNVQDLHRDRVDIWFRNAVAGHDQLRQRVAFALSEIMVVSQVGALGNQPYSLASYYDLLATRGLGNYRELIEAVTLHPAMGVYLSMLGNQKPNPAANIRPDENYARELMQLFTIGLVELDHRRYAEARRRRPAHPDVHAADHRGVRARVHGLDLRRHRELLAAAPHAPESGAADAALPELPRYGREARARRRHDSGGPGRRRGSSTRRSTASSRTRTSGRSSRGGSSSGS